jgi:hypothetical protein
MRYPQFRMLADPNAAVWLRSSRERSNIHHGPASHPRNRRTGNEGLARHTILCAHQFPWRIGCARGPARADTGPPLRYFCAGFARIVDSGHTMRSSAHTNPANTLPKAGRPQSDPNPTRADDNARSPRISRGRRHRSDFGPQHSLPFEQVRPARFALQRQLDNWEFPVGRKDPEPGDDTVIKR